MLAAAHNNLLALLDLMEKAGEVCLRLMDGDGHCGNDTTKSGLSQFFPDHAGQSAVGFAENDDPKQAAALGRGGDCRETAADFWMWVRHAFASSIPLSVGEEKFVLLKVS
jgi:hypothetical protein